MVIIFGSVDIERHFKAIMIIDVEMRKSSIFIKMKIDVQVIKFAEVKAPFPAAISYVIVPGFQPKGLLIYLTSHIPCLHLGQNIIGYLESRLEKLQCPDVVMVVRRGSVDHNSRIIRKIHVIEESIFIVTFAVSFPTPFHVGNLIVEHSKVNTLSSDDFDNITDLKPLTRFRSTEKCIILGLSEITVSYSIVKKLTIIVIEPLGADSAIIFCVKVG